MATYHISETEKGPVVNSPIDHGSQDGSIAPPGHHAIAHGHGPHVLGTIDMMVNGKRKLVPVPSADPNDPLNMPSWKRWMAVISLCLFGAVGLTVQMAVAAMLPIFQLEYSGQDPKILNDMTGFIPGPPNGPNGFRSADMARAFPPIPNAPTAQQVSYLGSLPMLLIGIVNFIAVPISNAIGRRPVMLICAILNFAMLPWAAKSQGLWSHLAARSIQAFGAGVVEAMVPLIMQDFSFIHERNKFVGLFWASGAIIATVFAIIASHLLVWRDWRWFYWVMTIPGGIAFLGILFFLPETRFARTSGEMEGDLSHLPPGEVRPELDIAKYGERKWGMAIFNGEADWPAAWNTVIEMAQVTIFPNVTWIVLLNSVLIGTVLAAQMCAAPVLLLAPFNWPVSGMGYMAVPILICAVFSYLISGVGGDWLTMRFTKRNNGVREPEHQLINFILPVAAAAGGSIWFGYIGDNPHSVPHWIFFLMAMGIQFFGFLSINTLASVYAIECYPSWAGATLVIVSSLRNVISFGMNFGVYPFIDARGYFGTFTIFAGLIIFVGLFAIPMAIYGKRMRMFTQKWARKPNSSKSHY